MLSELVVEGVGVIDRAELHLTEGSSALTGETGAGKTLLVASLGLLRGARSDKALLREGSPQARVQARFVVPRSHPVVAVAGENDLLIEDTDPVELVLTRVLGADGRSKARINGNLVTLGLLEEIGSALIEITGQSEHHSLSSSAAQRDALDAYAGDEAQALAREIREMVTDLASLRAQEEALRSSERDRQRDMDVLAFEIAEIEAVRPRPGESEELKASIDRLEHAEEISGSLESTLHLLRGDAGIGELLAGATAQLAAAAERDPRVAPLLQRISSADIELTDVAEELARLAVPADPAQLASLRERASELSRLRRKYGPDDSDVVRYLEDAQQRLRSLETSDRTREEIQERIRRIETSALERAARLSEIRSVAARRLSEAVESLLTELALEGARFEVRLDPSEQLHSGGAEKVSFLVAANPGEAPKPISKVASGGELSRIALALRLLTSVGPATTVVFDEVDAGVGGEAARAVGRCLADLGRNRSAQALVVTHLPQVAAFADHQYRVAKSVENDRTSSRIERVDGDDRVAELSRMLAGLPGSSRAREHARELLEVAARKGAG